MAKRKELKSVINNICTDLAAEVVAVSLYESKPADYVRRVSHVEPGMKPKEYFNNLIEAFNNDTLEVIDQITNLN